MDTLTLSPEVVLIPKTRSPYSPELRSTWFVLDDLPRILPGSLSPLRSRSARGRLRPISKRADALHWLNTNDVLRR